MDESGPDTRTYFCGMAQYPIIPLLRGKEVSLARRHRWVFSGALGTLPEGLKEGELVLITDQKGKALATGHYHPNGSIAVRVLEFDQVTIDAKYWASKLKACAEMRAGLGFPNHKTDCYRLVNAEGDGLPGLIIDIYGEAAVIQVHTTGMRLAAPTIADALAALFKKKLNTIVLRDATGKEQVTTFIKGTEADGVVTENGLQFYVNWAEGQKTGFFLDQRDSRKVLGEMATGRTVLNAFCYTGGFSIYALANGAKHVSSIDISKRAMEMVQRNHVVNGLSANNDSNHDLLCGDVFDHLADASGYDLIILDPPSFAKHIKARHNAVMGYKRLNQAAMKALPPNGLLFTFSCTQVVDQAMFEGAVLAAAIELGREVSILQRLGHGPDHPVSIFHPEGDYLKGLVLQVK